MKRIMLMLSLLAIIGLSLPVTAEDENLWSVRVIPTLVFMNETANITVEGPPESAFVLSIKNETSATVFMKQYYINTSGNVTISYQPMVNGTFFIFIGDGESFFTSPASMIVVEYSDSQEPTKDDIQDKRIDQLIRDVAYKGVIILKLREWTWMALVMALFSTNMLILVLALYIRHLIHEHPTYWNRESPVTLAKYAMMGHKKYDPDDGLRGLPKYLAFILASKSGEIEGFRHQYQNPEFFEEMMPVKLDDLLKGVGSDKVKRRIWKLISSKCPVCGLSFNRFGPETPCSHCGAISEDIEMDTESNEGDENE